MLCVDEEVEHKTKYSSGRASYIERNQAMVDESDFCLFYYDKKYIPQKRKISKKSFNDYQPKSGTAIAYKYAKQKGKKIENLYEY